MEANSPRWNEIHPSEYPWEREALAFVRQGLPDHDPYRVWTSFDFTAHDGSLNQVDLLVLSPNGLFHVEVKSFPGLIRGDAGTWNWERDGKARDVDHPRPLANQKSKKLKQLLGSHERVRRTGMPYVETLVFLSAPDAVNLLDRSASDGVHLRDDRDAISRDGQPGILERLTHPRFARSDVRINRELAKALEAALEKAGIRKSQRERKIHDFVLDELLYEGPDGYQDWKAHQARFRGVQRKVRIYPYAISDNETARLRRRRAAEREFAVLRHVEHPGILRALDFAEPPQGAALFFDFDPEAERLDRFVKSHGPRLTIGDRVSLLRQLGEAVSHAHKKGLVHRALSPLSVQVRQPATEHRSLQIFNWQVAGQLTGATTSTPSMTQHVDVHVEPWVPGYLAPETSRGRIQETAEQTDVFSLGTIAWFLFTGQAPAVTASELIKRLQGSRGLELSAHLDSAPEALCDLIREATHPLVTERTESADAFLRGLAAVEDAVRDATSDDTPVTDPMRATAGDVLAGGFEVLERLGTGATSVAYYVRQGDRECVLKLANDPRHNDRLEGEAEVLRKLRHHLIVAIHDTVRVGDRVGILMERAGKTTLGQRLRSEGRLTIDLLERLGDDLLAAVAWLEDAGIPHRDLKPDNLGVKEAEKSDTQHLVLFDFSLARTAATDIHAGTVPYLDPFLALAEPQRWEPHAERFSAAMVLHEMATGTLPKWGDGQSDPAVLTTEVKIDPELFDAPLRKALPKFFKKALARDTGQRFASAAELAKAWRTIFATLEAGDAPDGPAKTSAEQVTLDTALELVDLSTRARNALERVNTFTVRDLLDLPFSVLPKLAGVGNKTRRELQDAKRRFHEIGLAR